MSRSWLPTIISVDAPDAVDCWRPHGVLCATHRAGAQLHRARVEVRDLSEQSALRLSLRALACGAVRTVGERMSDVGPSNRTLTPRAPSSRQFTCNIQFCQEGTPIQGRAVRGGACVRALGARRAPLHCRPLATEDRPQGNKTSCSALWLCPASPGCLRSAASWPARQYKIDAAAKWNPLLRMPSSHAPLTWAATGRSW